MKVLMGFTWIAVGILGLYFDNDLGFYASIIIANVWLAASSD